jgi:hypothetical protein
MPNGFFVQPDKLAEFQSEVKTTADDYRMIVGQLDNARLTNTGGEISALETLLGAPEMVYPSGPPVDFTNSSRTLLTKYDMLLGALRSVHAAVGGQLDYMSTSLGETHALYQQVDSQRANVFDNLLDDRPSDGS